VLTTYYAHFIHFSSVNTLPPHSYIGCQIRVMSGEDSLLTPTNVLTFLYHPAIPSAVDKVS
jgi:hypothetical protein